jgi:hypothetical protein
MRTIFTLLIGMALSLAAAAEDGRLSLSLPVDRLYAQIDGRQYAPVDNVIYIGRISAGRHTVRVFRRERGTIRQLYSTQVLVRPSFHVDITFNRFGKAFIDEQRIGLYGNADDDQWSDAGNSSGYWDHGNGGNGNDGWNGAGSAPMTATSFSALLAQVRAERFDNTKQTIVKEALAMNRVSAAQVKQLLQQFTFDSDRMEIAKAAYLRTVDRNNYFQVMDVFQFSSSREELASWIRTQNP